MCVSLPTRRSRNQNNSFGKILTYLGATIITTSKNVSLESCRAPGPVYCVPILLQLLQFAACQLEEGLPLDSVHLKINVNIPHKFQYFECYILYYDTNVYRNNFNCKVINVQMIIFLLHYLF